MTKINLFKPKLFAMTFFLLYAVLVLYMWATTRTHLNSVIVIGYCVGMVLVMGLCRIFINKMRHMLNLLSLILVYVCILLINMY